VKEYIRASGRYPLEVVPEGERIGAIVGALSTEVTTGQPDFDELFRAGQVSGKLKIQEVESALVAWLTSTPEFAQCAAMDAAACFLYGYWRYLDSVDDDLVRCLDAACRRCIEKGSPTEVMVFALLVAWSSPLRPATRAHLRDTLLVLRGAAAKQGWSVAGRMLERWSDASSA
jgi:hypothetical protein